MRNEVIRKILDDGTVSDCGMNEELVWYCMAKDVIDYCTQSKDSSVYTVIIGIKETRKVPPSNIRVRVHLPLFWCYKSRIFCKGHVQTAI